MKRHCFFVVSFVLLILSTIISCDATPENLEKVAANYATPTIKGTITIPEGSDVAPEDVYIKVIDNQDKTVAIKKANADKSFVIQNLNAEMKYKLLFTSEEPEFTNRSVTRGKKNGVGGWLNDVVPAIKEGNDVGSVKMKPLGTIKGRAFIDGETEHYDITVYIPGTSYSAITDKDGNFSIYSVPEGTYTLRYVLDNHLPIMVSDVMLVCPENVENPEKTVGDVKLLSNKGTVQGKAYLGDSTDSTGITIKLESEDKTRSYDSSTSQDGNYVINNVEPGRYRIIASYSTYLSQMTGYFDVLSATITTAPEQISLFEDVGVLTGSASLSEQSIKEGIQILIKTIDGTNSYTLLTDSNGSFTKTLKPGSYTVTAIYPGYTSQSVETMVVKDSTSNVVIPSLTLSSGVVTGLVKLEGGSEYSGVTVTLIDPTDSKSTLTAVSGVDGSFSIQGITKSGTYLLSYTKDGYVSSLSNSVEIQVGKVTTVETVTLASIMSTVKGKVELEGTTSYESITILIKNDKTQYQTTSNNKGEYTINGVLPGTYTLLASKDGYVTATTGEFVVESSSEKRVETLSLSIATRSIIGKVELEMLSDYSGVLVTATNVEDTKKVYSAITNSSGTYTLAGLVPGAYSLVISYTGYRTETISNVNVVSSSVTTIPLKKMTINRGTITGLVKLEGGSEYSGVTVTLTDPTDSKNTLTAVSGVDGSFSIQGITKSGTYLLSYTKDGYVSSLSNSVEIQVGKVTTVETVTLASIMSTVKGKVELEGTTSYESITILIKNDKTQYQTTSNNKGEYTINGVLPGTYTLLASKDGYVTATTGEFVVESSSEKRVETLSLSIATRSIIGKVELEMLSDYSGVLVTATNVEDTKKVYSAITNSSGTYTLAGLVPGAYSLVISYTGYRTETISNVNVVSSSVTTIPLKKMTINRGTISGVVSLEGRSNSSGINVELLRGSVICESTTTDSSGSYSFYVPQGNYTGVRYSCSDFASSSIAKDIALFADNYFSLGNEVLKATHNSVFGSVDVLTTDDESGVTISFDGISTIERFITASDGLFRFDHIPLGNYTLRLQRQDCSDITIPIEVKASDGIDLSKIEITPNTATIKGKVNLNKAVSLSKVKVSVDMGSGRILETHTDDSGRYEIGGVSIADEYAVSYSKDGWNSQTQKISPKLSILEVRELNEVTLFDTTAPNLTNVVINNGANTTSNKNITLNITASDNGSGIDKIMVTYDNIFDRATRQYDYSPIFNWELPAENGTKTIYVKVVDRAGNESPSFKASVELTNQKTEVSGVLTGDKLTWTKDKSPYYVTGSVLVKEGTTLTIKEGVDVQFSGAFGITVDGKIEALGTEAENILFCGIENGENNWLGINCRNDNNSMLRYVKLENANDGVTGYISVLNSSLKSDNYVLSNFKGEVHSNEIIGNIKVYESSIVNNRIMGCVIATQSSIYHNEITGFINIIGSSLINNTISLEGTFEEKLSDCYLSGNCFAGGTLSISGTGENNEFKNMSIGSSASFINATFDGCSLDFDSGCLFSCVLAECTFGMFNPTLIRDSNFINCNDVIEIKTSSSSYEEIDLSSNFWGYANTKELKKNGLENRSSFISDYYSDSRFSTTKANLSNYREEPNSDAGYKGDSYYNYPEEVTTKYDIGSTGPAGGTVFYDKGFYSNGWRYLEVAPSNVNSNGIIFGYYKATENSAPRTTGTSTAVGSGKLNTKMLVKTMKDNAYKKSEKDVETTSDYAAKNCFDYTYGGYSDWFLPSLKEGNLIGEAYRCWSSSEYNSESSFSFSGSEGKEISRSCSVKHLAWDGIGGVGPYEARPIRSF